jgi:hypothetical protein
MKTLKNTKLLFPADYFDSKEVNPEFKSEFEAAKLAGFDCYLFNEDLFSETGLVRVNFESDELTPFLYRGWMKSGSEYAKLYDGLIHSKYIALINTLRSYLNMHDFAWAYQHNCIRKNTPEIRVFDSAERAINYEDYEYTFDDYFMIKDNVKSVKGSDFPKKFNVKISKEELKFWVEKFVELRGPLYTGNIITKQFVDLKHYDNHTNEYRIFFTPNSIVSISRNSNQQADTPVPPAELLNSLYSDGFHSSFWGPELSKLYTVDVAELEKPNKSGKNWIILECGDGQVSGLSPNQNQFEFYVKLKKALEYESV